VTGTPADEVTVSIDMRGRRCPLPVIELARRINDVAVGSVVAVVADDPAARLDVPAWCRMRDQDYVGERTEPDGVPAYLVRRRV